MTNVAKGVITLGLGGNQSSMIIGNIFNLGFFKIEVIAVPRPGGGGGGSRVFLPGEIQKFYRVVDNPYQVPYVYPLPSDQQKIPVTIRITFMGKTTEKIYLVKPKRGDTIITVLNLINTIKSRISIIIKNIKRSPSRIITYIKNVRNRDDE